MAESEADGVVRGGIAGVKRGDHVGAAVRHSRLGNGLSEKFHPLETRFRCKRAGAFDQLGARFHAVDAPSAAGTDNEIVENEPEIGFSGTKIDEHRRVRLGKQCVQGRPQQLHQMQHLLELPA